MPETIAKLVIKKSSVSNAVPPLGLLEYGELALNYLDGKLFYRNNSNVIELIGIRNPASTTANQTISGINTFTAQNVFNESQTFNNPITVKSITPSVQTLTDGSNITWNFSLGNLATLELTQNSTINSISNMTNGTAILRVSQDVTGNRTLVFGSNFKTVDGADITIASPPGSISIITFVKFGGSDIFSVAQTNFQ